MARIPVANPPKRRRKHKTRARKKARRVSAASLAALRKINSKRKNRRTRKHKVRSRRRHHIAKRRASHKRRKSTMKFNPFGSEMFVVNPIHKKRRHKMARKKHRRHHRRSRSLLSNPFAGVSGLLSKPKEMFTKDFAMQATATAVGFMAPNIVMNYIPASFRATKTTFYLSKIAVVAGVSTVVGMVNKQASRAVLIGGGVSLLLDLWAEWQARNKPVAPAATPSGTSAFYGDHMGAFYGPTSGMADDLVLTSPDGSY